MSLEQQLLAFCRQQRSRGRPAVLGLNGPVGAGKTSFSLRFQHQCAAAGLRLAVVSIDDAYLPWARRLQAMAGNPYGVTRVPPGSHDPDLLCRCIDRWREADGGRLQLPRFDKTLRQGEGDRALDWQGEADALLLEGWFLGCRPLDPGLAASALAELPGFDSAERAWALRCNAALEAYQPLWSRLDRLVQLWPQRWDLPRRWRLQAEARQRRSGGGWLSATALNRLVDASIKSLPPALYQQPLLAHASWVRLLDGRRRCVWEGSGGAAFLRLTQS